MGTPKENLQCYACQGMIGVGMNMFPTPVQLLNLWVLKIAILNLTTRRRIQDDTHQTDIPQQLLLLLHLWQDNILWVCSRRLWRTVL